MAKTPEERPAESGPPIPTPTPDVSPTARVGGKRFRYNPEPGYRLLVCGANDYGEALPSPRMHAFPLKPAPGMTDQAEYLLTVQKPQRVRPVDWWREAEPEEMAAYQEETGAFGTGPLAADLRADWKARHPTYHEGPPNLPTTEGERVLKRLADALEKREKGGTP